MIWMRVGRPNGSGWYNPFLTLPFPLKALCRKWVYREVSRSLHSPGAYKRRAGKAFNLARPFLFQHPHKDNLRKTQWLRLVLMVDSYGIG